jgi:SnoaL-like domain
LKKTVTTVVIILSGIIAFTQNGPQVENESKMEKEKIIQSLKNLFAGADERDWQKVQGVMATNVLLDYTSMNGGSPTTQTPQQITDAWAAFLPGFDKTHHQLSKFEVSLQDTIANVHYFGKADHFIDKEVWTVEGTYDSELKKESNHWLVTKHKFNFIKQSGNTDLPAIASKKVQTKNQ